METKLRKFKALVNERGLDDGGVASFVFETDTLVKDKIYIQADIRQYDNHTRRLPPFFTDDISCVRYIDDMLKQGKVEEIFE